MGEDTEKYVDNLIDYLEEDKENSNKVLTALYKDAQAKESDPVHGPTWRKFNKKLYKAYFEEGLSSNERMKLLEEYKELENIIHLRQIKERGLKAIADAKREFAAQELYDNTSFIYKLFVNEKGKSRILNLFR